VSPKYTVFNVKLVNIITIRVVTFNDGFGALYGTLIPQMLRNSVHRTVVKEFNLMGAIPLCSSKCMYITV